MTQSYDVVIVGAGIAGASVAAELADRRKVAVFDMESAAGYHTTGRSAATYVPTYGPPLMRALTRASLSFFRAPPAGFAEHGLLSPRGELMMVAPGEENHIPAAVDMGLKQIPLARAKEMVPPLKVHEFVAAVYDENAEDIDVDALQQGFLRKAKASGCDVVLDGEVRGLARNGDGWKLETSKGEVSASVVVNAAGAWADEVAARAGAVKRGIQPKRRSAALVPVPEDWDISTWPLTFGAGETFYFRPMGGKLMVSPADATPVDPHDAWADDMLIAEAIEALQNSIDIEVMRLDHTWGGLRSFAPDGDPVVGYDPDVPGFFWLAGQGGYGIQNSPAMARCAAALIEQRDVPDDIAGQGVSADAVSPARLAPVGS